MPNHSEAADHKKHIKITNIRKTYDVFVDNLLRPSKQKLQLLIYWQFVDQRVLSTYTF